MNELQNIFGHYIGIPLHPNRPYRCPFCEYSSIQASTFKNHVASRHAGEEAAAAATAATEAAGTRSVYACRECSFKTVNRETYFGHLGNHRRQQKNSEEILDKDAVGAVAILASQC